MKILNEMIQININTDLVQSHKCGAKLHNITVSLVQHGVNVHVIKTPMFVVTIDEIGYHLFDYNRALARYNDIVHANTKKGDN